jgi:hypothetical protein
MNQPFQFSIGRMLGAVTLLGCSVQMSVIFFKLWPSNEFDFPWLAYWGLCGSLGALVGHIAKGRPLVGFICGLVAGAFLCLFLPTFPAARE